jgi:hypothetical protein
VKQQGHRRPRIAAAQATTTTTTAKGPQRRPPAAHCSSAQKMYPLPSSTPYQESPERVHLASATATTSSTALCTK